MDLDKRETNLTNRLFIWKGPDLKNCRIRFGTAFFLTCLTFIGIMGQAKAQYPGRISSIVVDMDGNVLSQKDANLKRYPASLTKMMTLYMTFRALRANAMSLEQRIPISIHASIMEPSKLGLRPGNTLTVREAILALVTKSANDAACALGEFIGGGDEERFAQMMTQEARVLGMGDTKFYNASGLPNPNQTTTAKDFATLARHLIVDYPEYYQFFAVPYFNFRGRIIPNHDPLLKSYAGADGLKTGYTVAAGHNLVSSAVHSNVRLIGVVMGASSNNQRNALMANLLDDGFSQKGIAPVARPIILARSSAASRHKVRRRGHSSAIQMAAASSTKSKSHRNVTSVSTRVASRSTSKRLSAQGNTKKRPLHFIRSNVVTSQKAKHRGRS